MGASFKGTGWKKRFRGYLWRNRQYPINARDSPECKEGWCGGECFFGMFQI
jgi:hypothetical protein